VKWVPPIAVSLFVVLALPAQAVRQADIRTMTIRLVSTDADSRFLTDRPPLEQAGKGDVIVVDSTLRNAVAQFGRAKGAVVGNDTVIFTIRSRTDADVIVESSLPGGWLRAGGRARLGPKQTYSVTGGGGRFAGARGTGESVALGPSSNRRLKLYRLRLP
jgi:hypothetical protein